MKVPYVLNLNELPNPPLFLRVQTIFKSVKYRTKICPV